MIQHICSSFLWFPLPLRYVTYSLRACLSIELTSIYFKRLFYNCLKYLYYKEAYLAFHVLYFYVFDAWSVTSSQKQTASKDLSKNPTKKKTSCPLNNEDNPPQK